MTAHPSIFVASRATFFFHTLSNGKIMNDKLLVENVLKGDEKAFESLMKQYQRLVGHIVFRIVGGMEKEEVMHDVFLKVYRKLGEFNFQSKLSTWIATIAYREAINHARKNKRNNEMQDLDSAELVESDVEGFESKDMSLFVQAAVDKLPVPYRSILTLYHLQGFSYQEIVEVMEMPEGTVKNYLFRARKKLKEILAPYIENEALLG